MGDTPASGRGPRPLAHAQVTAVGRLAAGVEGNRICPGAAPASGRETDGHPGASAAGTDAPGGEQTDDTEEAAMVLLVAFLLVLLFFGLGFALHLLWIAAIVLLVFWLVGWVVGRGQRAGSHRFYRW